MNRNMGLKSRFSQLSTEERNVTDMQTWKDASVSSLPMEILEHIFCFLQRDDLLQAMSVCTRWKSLISSSPNLWTRQTFILDCDLRYTKKTKVDMFYCVQNFGPHFRTLTVKCQHPESHLCITMADKFNLFLSGLRAHVLTSFKVFDLQVDNTSRIVIKKINKTLKEIIAMERHLKIFEMPAAHWPKRQGRELLNTVLQKSRNTLEILNIKDFFIGKNGSVVEGSNWFSTGLTSLTNLTKLSITIYYLTDELVLSLARARRGQLTHLSLLTNFIFTNTVQRDSWDYLWNACPNVAIKLTISGLIFEPQEALPYFFEPLELPIRTIKMIVNRDFQSPPSSVTGMTVVLDYVRNHYRPSLKSFTLDVNNEKEENFDQALINLVRECPLLVNVKVLASFHSGDTAKTIDNVVAERLPTPLTSTGPENKYVQIEDNASRPKHDLELYWQ
uniref:F-box domain-containing protein n=1 Tax=Biomphalaria glabrata TaxID=6526 RepID=A0A2C9LH16_BIOGL